MALETREALNERRKLNIEELFVFGYTCKLFRDDEKARHIDQGKHLIPCMGDESVKIDRYDGRAALSDLREVEAPAGGFDRFTGFDDKEKSMEVLCDGERYRSLNINEEEINMYLEEEVKRVRSSVNKAYGEVQYSYSGEVKVEEDKPKPVIVMEDKPFAPSPLLDIPLNMVLPPTMKQNAVIEKTASFISSQGPQMEIILKMKQAKNPMFDFLSFENSLHGYYKLVLQSVKSGRYRPVSEEQEVEENDDDSDGDHYLHPSLLPSVKVNAAPSIPTLTYKPSENCAYSMLVNKLKDRTILNRQLQESDSVQNMDIDIGDNSNEERVISSTNSGSQSPSIASPGYVQNSSLETPSISVVMPAPAMQIIIDKMASYAAKNGRDFETIVRNKKDSRFDFLNVNHIHHGYYQAKLQLYSQMETLKEPDKEEIVVKKVKECVNQDLPSSSDLQEEKNTQKVAPVCFSIKSKEAEAVIIDKSALPLEDSSEGEDDQTEDKIIENKVVEVARPDPVVVDASTKEDHREKAFKRREVDLKKNKLTAVVRERVATIAKEKSIQLERKRKLAEFLKMINVPSSNTHENRYVKTAEDTVSDVESLPDPESVTDKNQISSDSDIISVKSSSSGSSQRRHRSKSKKKKSPKDNRKRKHKSSSHRKHSSKKHKKHHRRSPD